LVAETTLPATTAVANAALTEIVISLNMAIEAGYKINFALGTTVAAGWQATVVGGDY
jgi:hypothetical protein